MAYRCHKQLGLLLWLLLPQLQLWVVAQEAVEQCKALLPASEDLAWKDSFGGEETYTLYSKMSKKLRITRGQFTQGGKPLVSKPSTVDSADGNVLHGVNLKVSTVMPSSYRDTYVIGLTLSLGFWQKFNVVQMGFRGTRGKPRTKILADNDLYIAGEGVYSATTGALCMFGCVGSDCSYHLSLQYPIPKTIRHVSVTGNITCRQGATDPHYFDPVSITATYGGTFEYTKNETLKELCPTLAPDVSSGKLWKEEKVCAQRWQGQLFQVSWNSSCEDTNCSPFKVVGRNGSQEGGYMKFERAQCDNNRVSGVIGITEGKVLPDRFADPTASDGILVAEGVWDSVKGQLCLVACRLHGQCSLRKSHLLI